ncbi:hypothetical protein HDU87_003373 [Geranomyces variabilis]|uniref:Adenylate cyclase-associated CAP C-terminal domain-containing protein n=1 Tax=Geranomyces variabilis TaxID=109894 RepID=A0AAD5TJZ8_9FUNG|nr:hypothetical protein HDU87_003373 [Geranomyces variabilis]
MNVNMFALLNSRPQRVTYENLEDGREEIAAPSRSPVPFFITHCEKATIDLQPAKAAVVQVERSHGTHVTVGVTVGVVEVISSQGVSIVVKSPADSVGTVTVDDSTDITIEVPEGWTIYTTRCKNVAIHGDIIVNDSSLEGGLTPFRLRTSSRNGVWTTVRSNLYGDELRDGVEVPAR